MKEFVKIVFGNLVAMALFLFFGFVFIFVIMAALLMDRPEVTVDARSVMIFDMNVAITDAPPGADLWRLLHEATGGLAESALSLRTVAEAIERAAGDDRISALYLRGSFIASEVASGYPTLREVRMAIERFRESGKPVYAYLQNPSIRDYYVASVADEIFINPFGAIGLNGLASQQVFLAGLLEKYGVGVQVSRAGDFKAAVEIFSETEMSPENREQTTLMLADIWQEVLESIAAARGVPPEDLQRLTDTRGFLDPDEAVAHGLADRVGRFDEVLEALRDVTATRAGAAIPQIRLDTYHESLVHDRPAGRRRTTNRIAVVYLEGDLMDGTGMAGMVGGETYAREIRQLRQHPNIRALVIRVNSPGGSVTAADAIQREIALARQTMPVVVSFGSFAASGGYWVAVDSDRIFTQPSTITGSIGVFGVLPNFKELANRHGVNFDVVKTGEFADLFSVLRPKTEQEMALIQEFVDKVYDEFLERVARGRNLTVDQVRPLAGGRIWSGARAVESGLADEIGGLFDAIHYAAERAELDRWEIYEYPRPPRNFAEMLAEWFEEEEWQPLAIEERALDRVSRRTGLNLRIVESLNDPRGAYVRLPYLFRIE